MSIQELNEHRMYWNDRVKCDAYRKAIEAAVGPDTVVLDLGSGTGLLGLLAARAGARRVYSVDSGPIIGLVEEVAAANGYADTIVAIHASSKDLELPEPVDLIVGDQIGGLAFDAGVMEYYADALRRLGDDHTTTIPASFDLFVAPVTYPEGFGEVDFWKEDVIGFDLSAARRHAQNSFQSVHLNRDAQLGLAASLTSHGAADDSMIRGRAKLAVDRSGVLHGVVGYFVARMTAGITMTNDPFSDERMDNRWQMFLPIPEAVPVSGGEEVTVEVLAAPTTYVVTWKVKIDTHDGTEVGSWVCSTFAGDFLDNSTDGIEPSGPLPPLGTRGELDRIVGEEQAGGGTFQELFDRCAKSFPAEDQGQLRRHITAAVLRAAQNSL